MNQVQDPAGLAPCRGVILAGEYEGPEKWLILDVAGHVIVDSRTRSADSVKLTYRTAHEITEMTSTAATAISSVIKPPACAACGPYAAGLPKRADEITGWLNESLEAILPDGLRFEWVEDA